MQELHPVYALDVIQDFRLPRLNATLTGSWSTEDQGTEYLRQTGNTVWWLGMSRDRGRTWANVFRGIVSTDAAGATTITGDWADVPLGSIRNGGTLAIRTAGGVQTAVLNQISQTGNFGATVWSKLYDAP